MKIDPARENFTIYYSTHVIKQIKTHKLPPGSMRKCISKSIQARKTAIEPHCHCHDEGPHLENEDVANSIENMLNKISI